MIQKIITALQTRVIQRVIQYCAKEMQTKFGVFVLCSRENSTKFHHEISSKRSRIFVKSNEISLSFWRNFASTEAKFRFAEISSERRFATAKFRNSENSRSRKFAAAKFPQSEICWQWRRVVIKTFSSDRFKSLARVIYLA